MRVVITLPALNEERVIESTVRAVRRFVDAQLAGHEVTVMVVDNGSVDATEEICRRLAGELQGVRYLRLSQKGKGLAIREGWTAVPSDAYVFMDADLAVELSALPALVRAIEAGAGLAVGTRYHQGSVVQRSALRKVLSRGYRAFVGLLLETKVSDIPCGFKAASAAVVRDIVPTIRDNRWFFDTELVIRAERAGFQVAEVPVTWRELKPEGRVSKVRVFSLVREYFTRVFALRREIGPLVAPSRSTTFTELVRSVSKKERLTILVTAVVVAVLGLIAPLLATLNAHRTGVEWSGRQFLAPGDFAVYLSYIAQAKAGHLLFANTATTEHLVPVFNILWLLVGWLAKLFNLTPLAAYHFARTLLVFPFIGIAYLAIAYVYREVRQRYIALGLLVAGSGLGLYAASFIQASRTAPHQWPIDFWVAESNVFMTLIYSPHFIASFGLIIAVALLLLMALDTERLRYGAWAGLLGLVLFEFHPFHAPTLYALAIVALLTATARRGFRLGQWGAVALFGLLSLPTVAYQLWLTRWSPNAAFMFANNVTTTPSFGYVAIGMGIVLPLAAIGWWLEAKGKRNSLTPEHLDFLGIWVIVQLLMIYAPFPFQRRLIEGWQVPLTLLAVPTCLAVSRWKAWRIPVVAAIGSVIALALVIPSTFSTVVRGIEAANPTGERGNYFFFSREESEALAWISKETPSDAVLLADIQLGNDIMGWGDRTVYAGHWANTIDVGRKQQEIARFFGPMHNTERASFMQSHGITFVVVGPEVAAIGRNPCQSDTFSTLFHNAAYEICALNQNAKTLKPL